MQNLEDIRQFLIQFARERDWQQFHSSKNLSMALSVEVAELQEHFQWLTPEQCDHIESEKLAQIAEEIADVQMYLVLLADRLGVNILDAVRKKSVKNIAKYPAEVVKGSPKKYNEYPPQK